MVTRYNIGRCPGNPPADGSADGERKVSMGPVYPKDDVLSLLKADSIRLWTRNCQDDVRKLDLELPEVALLVVDAVVNGRFKSSEWCEQNPDGPWAICDAYVLTRKEWNSATCKELQCEYYVKFAIARSGIVLLLVSCHV